MRVCGGRKYAEDSYDKNFELFQHGYLSDNLFLLLIIIQFAYTSQLPPCPVDCLGAKKLPEDSGSFSKKDGEIPFKKYI